MRQFYLTRIFVFTTAAFARYFPSPDARMRTFKEQEPQGGFLPTTGLPELVTRIRLLAFPEHATSRQVTGPPAFETWNAFFVGTVHFERFSRALHDKSFLCGLRGHAQRRLRPHAERPR